MKTSRWLMKDHNPSTRAAAEDLAHDAHQLRPEACLPVLLAGELADAKNT
jgi:hypothetical protein